MEPPVFDGLAGGFGITVVALHDIVAAYDDLAVLSDRREFSVGLPYPAFHRGGHDARCAEFMPSGGVGGNDRCSLRQAVSLIDRNAYGCEECLLSEFEKGPSSHAEPDSGSENHASDLSEKYEPSYRVR